MDSYQSQKTRTKLDYFIEGQLKKTFNSYKHISEHLKIEYNNNDITESVIKNLVKKGTITKGETFKRIYIYKNEKYIKKFNNTQEFKEFCNISPFLYEISIIKNKIIISFSSDYEIKVLRDLPDIRLHIFEKTESMQICNCCEISKELNEKNYTYKNKIKKLFNKKCKECVNNKLTNYDKNIKKFNEQLNDNWKKHPEFTNYYFERHTTKIFNIDSGLYLTNIIHINNKEVIPRTLKWEAFYGKIKKNQIVKYKNKENIVNINDGIELDNLECVFIYCENCNKIVENPKSINQIYCSKKCQNIKMVKKNKNNLNSNFNCYINHKFSIHKQINKKYKTKIDYDKDYLISLELNCFYCNIQCKFGYDKEINHPDTLSYDKKNPDVGYIKENIVVCCWFCNRMKNQTCYEEWIQFINFIKNKENILDLSKHTYTNNSKNINLNNIYFHIKDKSPSYYKNLNSARNVFINLCKQQNYVDPFFHFFPIIYFKNSLFNASIDAINSNLDKKDKHNPNNIQVIPKCFNYGKNTLSNEQFIQEWKKRGFKTDFTNCLLKLPENYIEESYFNKYITKK
jgi:hypothetical protein